MSDDTAHHSTLKAPVGSGESGVMSMVFGSFPPETLAFMGMGVCAMPGVSVMTRSASENGVMRFSRSAVSGVFAHHELAALIFEVAPHAVQMDRVGHHRVVDQHHPNPLAIFEARGFGVCHNPKPPWSPPAASPFTKVRLDVLECMPFSRSVSVESA